MRNLEQTFGIDLFFDSQFGVRGTKDVGENSTQTDFLYSSGPAALAEELRRLFDLTPRGSFIDDPEYGINWEFIGQPLDPRVAVGLTKIEVLRALEHPSFKSRFRVRWLDAKWKPNEPTVIRVGGLLELYGFEGVPYVRFGPYALNYLNSNG